MRITKTVLISYQIFQTNLKNCMQTVRGTTKEILGVKGLKHHGTHKKQGLFQDLPGPRLIFPRHKNFTLNCLIPKI